MAKKYPLKEVSLASAHRHWEHRIVIELVWPDDAMISIGQEAIDAIIPYSEPGEMGPTIWFEVVRHIGDFFRVNGSFLTTVSFAEVPPNERMDD